MIKKAMILLTGILLIASAAFADGVPSAAQAVTVAPLPADRDNPDLLNGSYGVQIEEMDQVVQKQSMTLSLYLDDRYDPEQIKNLSPGDTVLVAGTVYTVREINVRDVHWYEDEPESFIYEIDTEENSWDGIYFLEISDGSFIACVGDWTPVTYVGQITVSLPLPASFVYYDYPGGEEPKVGSETELLHDLQDRPPAFFNPYNTNVYLKNGELFEMYNWSYPWGPETEELPDA